MDSSYTNVCYMDEVDIKKLLDGFFSPHIPDPFFKETTRNLMQAIYKAFITGTVTGRSVIDFSIGPIIASILPMNDFVQEITFLQSTDAGVKELVKWKNKDPDAFDWSRAVEFLKELKGKSENDEEILRGKTKILKYVLSEDNPADTLSLPQADIATSIWHLDTISKDPDDFRRNLRQLSKVLKLGGYLLAYADINTSYLKIGENTFHILHCDESFYRKVISDGGFDVKHCEKFDREMITDASDYEGMIFIIAQKVREP